MLKLSWIDQPKTAPIGGSLILSTISALAMGCGSIAAQKAQEKQDPESNSSTLSQSSAQAQSAKDSKNEFKGTIRSVRPNDWACLAWTVADVTMPNSIWDNILKREPKVRRLPSDYNEKQQIFCRLFKRSHYSGKRL